MINAWYKCYKRINKRTNMFLGVLLKSMPSAKQECWRVRHNYCRRLKCTFPNRNHGSFQKHSK